MNTIVFFFFVVAVAAVSALPAAILKHESDARVLRRDEVHDESGQFALFTETENGITITENGWLVPSDDGEGYVLIKKGKYSYYTPTGEHIEIDWTSDKNGFSASGDAIPKVPVVETVA